MINVSNDSSHGFRAKSTENYMYEDIKLDLDPNKFFKIFSQFFYKRRPEVLFVCR